MVTKDYAGWHIKKLAIDSLQSQRYFYEREIWWIAVGHNIGSEEDGKGSNYARPVLILRKFNQALFFGLPLSTTANTGKYYYPLVVNGVANKALLSQLRAFDAKRLINKLGVLPQLEFTNIQTRIIHIIKPPLARG